MEPNMGRQKAKAMKRRLVELYDDDNEIGRVYRFKVLLPNGTSIGLTVTDPGREMPFRNFIGLVKDEYYRARKQYEPIKQKKHIDWNSDRIYLEDGNSREMRGMIKFDNFNPHKCHILQLHDGSGEIADTFKNMWDLTPDTDLLKELPEEYTFETALADLIDNSLQAIWSNSKNDRRLISVNIVEDRISIFDTGPGMDGSDENSIAKWGKMGASLHRSSKGQAIGGKPPYLRPFFGMFGYGGPIASMHLGRRALVSSKTISSRKVYTLHLEREALLSSSCSELSWKTDGGMRDPLEDEVGKSPHGSFTKVEIFKPKINRLDILQLQCRLKDIYFPYIQCDEVSNSVKTITPIEFQVNGVDLAEIEGGEVAITNLHSCNGPEFVFQLRFFFKQSSASTQSPGSRACQEANARLKCVYLPVIKGKESIEIILEKLEAEGCSTVENYETFSRVSIRRLGRLLPDARWAWLPFMESTPKKRDRAHLLKRCCLRVKCFIETDAGFNPTPSKTDLAHHNPFTTALKNFGNKLLEKEKDVNVEIYRDQKLLTPLQLEREYQEWILHMHDQYDEETECGEDQPVLIVNPANKKALGISSDVIRLHRVLKRKGESWKSGQKIKILKGACAGCHKNNIYAALEYFLLEGFQGDAGGEARIICRPLDVPHDHGCALVENNGDPNFDIRSSLSLPINVIDSGKCVVIENMEWDYQLSKQHQKSPSTIDLLSVKQCQELEVDGALPVDGPVRAGEVPPKEIVAVVRPANFVSSGASKNLDQKHIVKTNLEMSMEVKFRKEVEDLQDCRHIYSVRITPSSRKGFHGLYIFPLGCKFPELFQKAGVYMFSFSVKESTCNNCDKRVLVKASPMVGKWGLLNDEQSTPYRVRVGSCFPPLYLACYDTYDNRIPFKSTPEVMIKLESTKGVLFHVGKRKTGFSSNKFTLEIKDLLIECNELDKIRPSYKATLVICSQDELFSVSIPCQVTPGSLQLVKAQPPIFEKNQLLPGCVAKEFILEMFDACGNHVSQGSEVQLEVEGLHILDQIVSKRRVDNSGCINLGGLLKVTAGYGSKVSLSVLSGHEVLFKKEFQTEERELRLASRVPEFCTAGTELENVVFEIVNSTGEVDEAIHDEKKYGQFHTLTIKSEFSNTEDSIQYIFKHGRCTVLAIPLPQSQGIFCFEASHSCHPELHLSVKVSLVEAPKVKYDEIQSPYSSGKVLLLQDSPSAKLENFMITIEKKIQDEILQIGARNRDLEEALDYLNNKKAEIEQDMSRLQAFVEPCLLNNPNYIPTKEELINRIESTNHSAAAVICSVSKESSFQEQQNHFMKDVVGLVALLGTVRINNLSRILAEYLGEDQMLAVVCRSFAAASALEKYEQNGEVHCRHALHAEASALGKSIKGRFLVVCLEDIRPYTGEFEGSGPQRKLALPHPTFPSGSVPIGFIGYAVNMIDLDIDFLCTRAAAGHGLRETLFYCLLGEVQVYETWEYMLEARHCIKHGAVSLDGGILRDNGVVSLGFGNPQICFPVVAPESVSSAESVEIIKLIEEKKSELRVIIDYIAQLTRSHDKSLKRFNKKKEEYNMLMDDMEPVVEDHHLDYRPNKKNNSDASSC
ncbi:structural maintenance of chromosomes flexible hinge domain-containing protein GMI1 [Corylus avellana]|uniref:structural maintenance of chromosomes flexible hinge domain-containing protein GMI1 n=1 Tax=Corylus avellana TaxID=13451 RepID=UPI00286A33C5|nr:structural maintenance of chromosomes flexible hinge domain-containing protein GMI1 [Corylus avellana]